MEKQAAMSCIAFKIVLLLLATTHIHALQNIRIQVNNENLQHPPYLLQALKQASAAETSSAAAAAAAAPQPTDAGSRLSAAPVQAQSLGRTTESAPVGALSDSIKEETIEELLDLSPASVLRLSPENLIQDANMMAAASEQVERHEELDAPTRKAQLPVTSSHLKRPAVGLELAGSQSNDKGSHLGDGAKSRVSPSVEEDKEPVVKLAGENHAAPPPPDTWEPNQVMQGVTNASLVPATVRRQYGHQTRTRVTLGGGYERDKLPALVESGAYDEPIKKPVAPLERPEMDGPGEESSSLLDQVAGDSSRVENSRIVEVPRRVVLPVGVFNQQPAGLSVAVDEGAGGLVAESQPAGSGGQEEGEKMLVTISTSRNTTVTSAAKRRRDSRCPPAGTKSLEHPTACDKYYLCQGGVISEHTCPNGLLYGTHNVIRDHCVHRWEAVCGDKSIPNPISSPGCRWQNGIFNVQGSPKCVPDFYECRDGQFEVRKCTIGGQVYDDKTKSCRYAEQVGCTQEALGDFHCPADDQANTYWPFPRYFLNERALIHCIQDQPQIIRCRDHERVDPEHLFCVPINKSSSPSDDETGGGGGGDAGGGGGQPEVTARRSTTNGQREKTAASSKPAGEAPVVAPAKAVN